MRGFFPSLIILSVFSPVIDLKRRLTDLSRSFILSIFSSVISRLLYASILTALRFSSLFSYPMPDNISSVLAFIALLILSPRSVRTSVLSVSYSFAAVMLLSVLTESNSGVILSSSLTSPRTAAGDVFNCSMARSISFTLSTSSTDTSVSVFSVIAAASYFLRFSTSSDNSVVLTDIPLFSRTLPASIVIISLVS